MSTKSQGYALHWARKHLGMALSWFYVWLHGRVAGDTPAMVRMAGTTPTMYRKPKSQGYALCYTRRAPWQQCQGFMFFFSSTRVWSDHVTHHQATSPLHNFKMGLHMGGGCSQGPAITAAHRARSLEMPAPPTLVVVQQDISSTAGWQTPTFYVRWHCKHS